MRRKLRRRRGVKAFSKWDRYQAQRGSPLLVVEDEGLCKIELSRSTVLALTNCAKGLISLIIRLDSLRPELPQMRVKIWEDTEATIKLALNPICITETRDTDARHHSLRGTFEQGKIELVHVCTMEQVADVLAWNLSSKSHSKHRKALRFLLEEDRVHLVLSLRGWHGVGLPSIASQGAV